MEELQHPTRESTFSATHLERSRSPGLVIRRDIAEAYHDLLGDQTVNGRWVNVADLIVSLTREFGPAFAGVLGARREFLHRVGTGKALHRFAVSDEVVEDVDGNTWTVAEIRQGMIDRLSNKNTPWRWSLNEAIPVPSEVKKPGLQGTGPFDDLGMAMGALNAGGYGATSWMADWEDAGNDKADKLYLAWRNLKELLGGKWDGKIYHHPGKNKDYQITVPRKNWPVIFHRVPGIHLRNRQIALDGAQVPAIIPALVIHTLNNYDAQKKNGSGIYFYVPKIETSIEALLVAKILKAIEEAIGVPRGTIKIEMLNERARYAANQELIMWVLRERLAGPNVGRWDYINSRIEMLKDQPEGVFPDPHTVGMTDPTMTDYTRRNALLTALVGGFPVGGMSAVMKNPKSPKEVNERAVRSIWFDKLRERLTGFMTIDGKPFDLYRQSWAATTEEEYVRAGAEPLQAEGDDLVELVGRLHDDEKMRLQALGLLDKNGRIVRAVFSKTDLSPEKLFSVKAWDHLFRRPEGPVTEKGLRYAIYMASEYMFQQLNGNNAAAIDDYLSGTRLMNDFATYEIFWHWLWTALHHGVKLTEDGESTKKGDRVTKKLIGRLLDERGMAVTEYFAQQDREGVRSRFDRRFAPITMDILRRQLGHPRWIMYGSRVLLSVVEAGETERKQILDAVFSGSREEVADRVKKGDWPSGILTAYDFVGDIFSPVEKAPKKAKHKNEKKIHGA